MHNGVLFVIAVSLLSICAAQNDAGSPFYDIFRDSQLLTVEGLEGTEHAEWEEKVKAAWETAKHNLESAFAAITSGLAALKGELVELILTHDDSLSHDHLLQSAKLRVNDGLHRLKEKAAHFKSEYDSAIEGLERDFTGSLAGVAEKAQSGLKMKWQQTKGRLQKAYHETQEKTAAKLHTLEKRWGMLFRKAEHHVAHKPHHPVMRCGGCGKAYTLREFMDRFNVKDVNTEEEDWWDDERVEHFYAGWSEWANRLGLHCKVCGARDWREVEFVSEMQEKELEAKSKHEEL